MVEFRLCPANALFLVGVTDVKNTKDGEVPEQLRIRREKRERILNSGGEAYPVTVDRTTSISELRRKFVVLAADQDPANEQGVTYLRAGDETDTEVAIAGRVLFIRNTGKLCFAAIQEGNGTQIQAMLSLAVVGADKLAAWKQDVDLGDIVSLRGKVIASKRGELSVLASDWHMASKALRPLPVAFADMSEDMRVRHRYTYLIMR